MIDEWVHIYPQVIDINKLFMHIKNSYEGGYNENLSLGPSFLQSLIIIIPKATTISFKVLRIPHNIVKDPLIWFEFILKKGSFGACLNHF